MQNNNSVTEKIETLASSKKQVAITKANTQVYGRAKIILTIGILGFIFFVSTIIILIFLFTPTLTSKTINITNGGAIILFLMTITPLVAIILNLTGSVLILTSKFHNDWLDTFKIIWGILSLLLLGPIGTIIFGSIAMSKLKTTKSNLPQIDNTITESMVKSIV